jgi:phosphoglycolate phosphatase-like HAD superfamily hydrolase
MLLALDIDNTLIDTRPSFTRIVKELTAAHGRGPGATDDDIALFKSTGMYNDDWELIRAFIAWRDGGRAGELVQHGVDARALLADARVVPFDPGEMSAPATALYRSGYWRNERVLVEGALLHALRSHHRVVACTGRDTWEFERAQELLDFKFDDATTMEHAKKPDPRALLRLVRPDDDVIVLVGDSEADRLCAERAGDALRRDVRFVRVDAAHPARDVLSQFV